MATKEQLRKAILAAGEAGDAEAVRVLGSKYREMQRQERPQLSAGEMVSNIPKSAMGVGQDLWNMATNPIDTAHNIGRAADGVLDKAGVQIPGTQNNEPVADAVGQALKDRYGGRDQIVNTLNTDPVGALFDVAGAVTGGASLARGGANLTAKGARAAGANNLARGADNVAESSRRVAQAGASVDPVNLVTTTAGNAAGVVARNTPYLRDWTQNIDAGEMYASGAKFRPSLSQEQRSRMGRTALDNDIDPTRGGFERLQDLGDKIDSQIDDIVSSANDSNTKLNTRHVRKRLEQLKTEKLGGQGLEGPKQAEIVQEMIDKLDGLVERNGRRWMTPDEMLDFKRQLYQDTEYGVQLKRAARWRNEARQTAARGAKETFEILDKDVKGLNQQWSDLLELEPELERAVGRMNNNQPVSIRSPIAAAGGGSVGGQGGAIAAFLADHLINSPGMRIRLAKLVRRIQNGQSMPPNVNRSLARTATVLAARSQEELEDIGLYNSVDR